MSAPVQPHNHHYDTHHRGTEDVPFDEVIGITPDGVPVVSNGDELHFSNLESITPACQPLSSFERQGTTKVLYKKLGYKWQCVEFVRRYLAARHAVWMVSVPTADKVWSTEELFVSLRDGQPVAHDRTPNKGATAPPKVGDVIVWDESQETPFGHVAVVTELVGQTAVRVAEQNQGFEKWPEDKLYSREIPVKVGSDGAIELEDEDPILGWVSVQSPVYDFVEGDVADAFRLVVGDGRILRQPFPRQVSLPWITKEEGCDYYLKHSLTVGGQMGKDAVAEEGDVPSAFYFIDYDMWCRIGRAANSLHRIAMEATAHVLADADSPHLLEHYFGVPPEIQPMLRRSWELTPPMGGRFDFGYDGKKIVMLEYNCDSSGALLECCDTQEKMAQSYGVTQGKSTGSFLGSKCVQYFLRLLDNSKVAPKHKLIHFMIDDDDEERYTAMCMSKFAEQAGLRTKICVKLGDFRFRGGSPTNAAPDAIRCDHPTVIDQDEEEVLLVWKTWSWDTVLHQYADQKANGRTGDTPSLSDILLNNHIRVLEPLWKAVTGSKAILPFMHALAPDHQNILPANFMPTKDIIRQHYITKPVNGRAGQNVMMFDPVTDESVLQGAPGTDQEGALSPKLVNSCGAFASSVNLCSSADRANECSTGKFFDSVVIYQKRVFLKKFEDKYFPIFCGWMVGDEFGGVVVREDTSKITKLASVVVPSRVVRENVPLGVAYADEGET